MAQTTTNLGKIHVFPSETLYNQFKDIIADNDLALLKDDGAYIVAALLEQNGYVKFSNGLILQWGIISSAYKDTTTSLKFPIAFGTAYAAVFGSNSHGSSFDYCFEWASNISTTGISYRSGGANRTNIYWVAVGKA